MALIHGRNARIYIKGVDLSGDLNVINLTSEMELADITTFGHVGYTLYPGLARDSATLEGLYNSTERTIFEGMIQTASGYGIMIAYGATSGRPAQACGEVLLKGNSIKSVVTDVNRISVSLDAQNRPFENCVLLSEGKQTVLAASTGGGIVVDNTAASATTGGAAYLQAFTVTGGTLTIRIEEDPTGGFVGAETTTATFAAASSSEAQRVAITTQIGRYARCYWTNTGSTAEFACVLKRN